MTGVVRIDTDRGVIQVGGDPEEIPLYSHRGFEIVSRIWTTVGWAQKYSYTFTWLGRPVIQLPEDLMRIQELIFTLRPAAIVETGVAHGGSLIFYASLCEALGTGQVIGVDISIRSEARAAIEGHRLSGRIALVEGSSVDANVVERVAGLIGASDPVLVILDSDHSRAHVRAELEAYSPFVSVGSYLVVTDGVMEDLHDVPGGRPEWKYDNPAAAADDFLREGNAFRLEVPRRIFDEGDVGPGPTYWPRAWLKRMR